MLSSNTTRETRQAEVRLVGITATRPVWALVSALCSLIAIGGAAWLQQLATAQAELYAAVHALQSNADARAAASSERLMRIETLISGVQERQAQRDAWQRRIEDKLDQLVADGARPPTQRPRAGASL